MIRFAYRAAKEFNIPKKDVYAAISRQLKQEWRQNGEADPIGKICVDMNFLTDEQLERILESLVMEPNINWGEKTTFAKMLQDEKAAKQVLGEYVGRRLAEQPAGISVFLSNSSTIYYVFLGMVKHGANLEVLTIHAAVLAAYPAVESKIRNVRTIWKGRVDLDNALVEPTDLSNPTIKRELGFLQGDVTHAVISATGFDCQYGPMADNATAREVARIALQSDTHTCIVIDHTKVRRGTRMGEPALLFRAKEWKEIRERKDLEVIVNCHPQMPLEQAAFKPSSRSPSTIRDILLGKKVSKSMIDQVVKYHEWSMRVRDILTEVPFIDGM
jgi:hypothetical protein